MFVKKMGGKIFGAGFTKAEQKAIDLEIQRQLAEHDREHAMEIDAIILWILHEVEGYGPKRLRRFYDKFGPALNALVKRYEMDDWDQIWLCTYKLKQYGIDLNEWHEGGDTDAN